MTQSVTPCGILVVTEKQYQELLKTNSLDLNAYYYIQGTRTLYLGRRALTPVFKNVEVLTDAARQPGHFFLEESTGAIIFCPSDKASTDFYIFPVHHGLDNVRKYLNVIMDQVTLLDLIHEYYPSRFWYTPGLFSPTSIYVFRFWNGELAELFWTDPENREGERAWKRTVIVRSDIDVTPVTVFDPAATIVYDSLTYDKDQWNKHKYTVLRENAFVDKDLDPTKPYRYTWFAQDIQGTWVSDESCTKTIEVVSSEHLEMFVKKQDNDNFLQHYYHEERYNG